jgi:hypothetical protein
MELHHVAMWPYNLERWVKTIAVLCNISYDLPTCGEPSVKELQQHIGHYETWFWGQLHVVSPGCSTMLKWYITHVLGKLPSSFLITEGKIFVIFTIWLWCFL